MMDHRKPDRGNVFSPLRTSLWTAGLTAVLAFVLIQLDVPRRVAYAVEKGKLEATREEVASVETISRVYRLAASMARPSVVFIRVERKFEQTESGKLKELFRLRPELRERLRPFATGSGVILDDLGHIVTNNHVVEDAGKIVVNLQDGRSLDAKVLGRDSKTDLAVIKIETDRLHPIVLGDSSRLEVGDRVLAIGNPFNLKFTVTEGIVSALGRANMGLLGDGGYEDFIQTDAAVNPGNSGGALVNVRGELVGINTAIASETGTYNGIAFAIPVNLVKQVTEKLKTGKPIQRGWLGVSILDLNREVYDAVQQSGDEAFKQLPTSLREAWKKGELKGVLVMEALAGTPAEKAGLKLGDLIMEVDSKKTTDVTSLRNYIAAQAPGDVVKLLVLRAGKEEKLKVTLGKQPDDLAAARRREGDADQENRPDGAALIQALGLKIEPVTGELAKKLKIKEHGVYVTSVAPNSPADSLGLEKGDLIEKVNGKPVNASAEFAEQLGKADLVEGVVLYVRTPGGQGRYVLLQVE